MMQKFLIPQWNDEGLLPPVDSERPTSMYRSPYTDAVCTMQSEGHSIRFSDVGQIRNSLARLATDNRHEEQVTLCGTLLGLLPYSRIFEFRTTTDEVIKGRISQSISEPETLNQYVGETLDILLHVSRVGDAKPRYQLLRVPIAGNSDQP